MDIVDLLADGPESANRNNCNDPCFVDDSEAADLESLERSQFAPERFTRVQVRPDEFQTRPCFSFDLEMERQKKTHSRVRCTQSVARGSEVRHG